MKENALNWFEIYVSDFAKAKEFYEAILNAEMQVSEMDNMKMAIFPYAEDKGIGGTITCGDCGKPGPGGTTVYLNVEGQLDEVIARITENGGKIIMPRTAIPPHGFIALLEDLEGNIVGLHSLS